MDTEEKGRRIKEADEVIRWAISHLKRNIKCKITDYKKHNFRVQFFSPEDNLIIPTEIPEEWVIGTRPNENIVYDQLELLCKNLDKI
jgi:hypothetical protein